MDPRVFSCCQSDAEARIVHRKQQSKESYLASLVFRKNDYEEKNQPLDSLDVLDVLPVFQLPLWIT